MRFSIYSSVKSSQPELCTHDVYLDYATGNRVRQLCKQIAAEKDPDKRGVLKKQLPIITWQAEFDGRRANDNAKPSGLFMLDIDHVEQPFQLYSEKVCSKIDELGIMYVGMTASQHGLRIVAKCRKEFSTLAECQKWLAEQIGIEFDGVCKDWARSSFLVTDDYTYYMNANMFSDEPEEGTVYATDAPARENVEMEEALKNGNFDYTDAESPEGQAKIEAEDTYHGIKYSTICKEWLDRNGGVVVDGERNTRLFKLATRLKYITDFNEAKMMKVMPHLGLPENEIRQLVHSAVGGSRSQDMPRDLRDVLDALDRRIKLLDGDDTIEEITTDTGTMPPMPPVIRQWVECAPQDFKQAVAMCQLPILGTLGSRLRARYLDGKMHTPSFQVSLEAPQASGKSFMTRIADYELAQVKEHDQEQREKEREYANKVAEMKMLNIKVNADNKDDILGQRPKTMIRYIPSKISITMLLKRMEAAQGLHCFSVDEEIDTVRQAYKSGFSNLSDLLRKAFDNAEYGQDYASENSISTILPIYYNTLFSGTPKAMRRFYPDVEDGLVSRVCFVTLPDQFGKPMPVWKEFTKEQKNIVDMHLVRLNDITIKGDEIQPEHVMKLNWLNEELRRWILAQQAEALKTEDRTRDTFCRRSAVVAFRAGMLAFFLYGEVPTPTIIRNVKRYSVWVANCMLNQFLLRFNIDSTHSNVNHWEKVYNELPDEFTRDELEKALLANNVDTATKQVIYKWRLLGNITIMDKEAAKTNGNKQSVKFKKVKK